MINQWFEKYVIGTNQSITLIVRILKIINCLLLTFYYIVGEYTRWLWGHVQHHQGTRIVCSMVYMFTFSNNNIVILLTLDSTLQLIFLFFSKVNIFAQFNRPDRFARKLCKESTECMIFIKKNTLDVHRDQIEFRVKGLSLWKNNNIVPTV